MKDDVIYKKMCEELDLNILSLRPQICLYKAGIDSLYDVSKLTESELMKIPDFNKKCLKEVKEVLKKYNMHLRKDP